MCTSTFILQTYHSSNPPKPLSPSASVSDSDSSSSNSEGHPSFPRQRNLEIFWWKLLWFLYLSCENLNYHPLRHTLCFHFFSGRLTHSTSRDHTKIKPKRIPQKIIRFYCISNCILKDYSDGVIFIFDECKYFLRVL